MVLSSSGKECSILPLIKTKDNHKINSIMKFYDRLSDLVNGWGYSENEAREILAEEIAEYEPYQHDFEC